MEVVGEGDQKLMHMWIREEFENISNLRNRGTSDLREEQRIRQELQLHEFDGSNVEGWILQLEDSFHFFQLDEEVKLKAAIISLGGNALRWFEWESHRQPIFQWKELKEQIRQCFTASKIVCQEQPDLEGWTDTRVTHHNSTKPGSTFEKGPEAEEGGHSSGGVARIQVDCEFVGHGGAAGGRVNDEGGERMGSYGKLEVDGRTTICGG